VTVTPWESLAKHNTSQYHYRHNHSPPLYDPPPSPPPPPKEDSPRAVEAAPAKTRHFEKPDPVVTAQCRFSDRPNQAPVAPEPATDFHKFNRSVSSTSS
jgi:hypothetical protein